jgi:hypothetical protein
MKWNRILILVSSLCGEIYAHDYCFPSLDTDISLSGDYDDSSFEYSRPHVTTYISPRSITNDLTYRNSNSFFQRFRGEASCTFITLDSTFLHQQNRRTTSLDRGFFGETPPFFAQHSAPFNSRNLGLGSSQPEGFSSLVRISRKRSVSGWLPQVILNLDYYIPGTWGDIAFAVTQVKHQLNFFEHVITPGDLPHEPTSVQEALQNLGTFPRSQSTTGVDDIQIRFGYVTDYCEDDMISFYILGKIPTGKKFDNSTWFQPQVGTQSAGIGGGIMLNGTMWQSELDAIDCLIMTELKYLYSLSSSERRQFDLKNGPLSRFLKVSSEDKPNNPISGVSMLRAYADIEPQHTLEWWIAFHYSSYCWGIEGSYNLWHRSAENLNIKDSEFNFGSYGIFDMTRCTDLTSHSTAKVSDASGEGFPDKTFKKLTGKDVDRKSACSKKGLTHTFAVTLTYERSSLEYPMSFAFGARYELPSQSGSALENWGIFGKLSICC